MEAKISGNEIVAKAVLAGEEERLGAMRANDSKRLAPLLADDLVYVFSSAIVENKAGYLMAIDHGTMKYDEDLHIRDVEVRAFHDSAIVMGVLESSITLYGGPHRSINRFTMLWTPTGTDGAWQMSMWQSTPVAPKTA
jgi:ketosteroid isomerase-like protein